MLSDFEVLRAADAMMNQFGEGAELQAARYADLMLGHRNRAGLLVWAFMLPLLLSRPSAFMSLAPLVSVSELMLFDFSPCIGRVS